MDDRSKVCVIGIVCLFTIAFVGAIFLILNGSGVIEAMGGFNTALGGTAGVLRYRMKKLRADAC